MTEHPSFKVNKALRKKLLMLAQPEQRAAYRLCLARLIGYSPYRSVELVKITGDRDLIQAWRKHLVDLIQIYAPRRKLKCGHVARVDYCERCAEEYIFYVQKYLYDRYNTCDYNELKAIIEKKKGESHDKETSLQKTGVYT